MYEGILSPWGKLSLFNPPISKLDPANLSTPFQIKIATMGR
jgi:hypothetical protein